ncbi:MAG: xanthine dehydrogenase family protein, partial [Chloroflexi bacterium]|nr:xanthine dehydrogenase family protein [Chloroflexota bacterium]
SHARIRSIDVTAALTLPGVEAVLTARDIPGIKRVGAPICDQPVLADGKVRQVGEPVAAVAAASEYIARQALARIKVDYEILEPVFDPLAALREDSPQVHEGGNLLKRRRIVRGEIARGFAEADVIVENTYTTPLIEHAYLEPESGLAYLDEEGRLILCLSCPTPHEHRKWVARVLDIDEEMIRVIQMTIGGDYGGKNTNSTIPIFSALALLCHKLKKPVKLTYTRRESFLASSKRHPAYLRFRTGATKDGRLTALQAEIVTNTGAYASSGTVVLIKALTLAQGPYYFPHVFLEGKTVYTNTPFCGAMKGFGAPQVAFAIESQMDLLAGRLGIDPLELRMRNAFKPGSETATGQILGESVGIRETLEAVRPYYLEMKHLLGRQENQKVKRGMGVACMWAGIGIEEKIDWSEAYAEMGRDGQIRIQTGVADVGQGTHTVLAQVAAQELGVPLDCVCIISGDTDLTPDCFLAVASKQTYMSGNAVRQAIGSLKSALLDTASKVLEQKAEHLQFRDGQLLSSADPSVRLSLKELAGYCQEAGTPLKYKGRIDLPLSRLDPDTGQGVLWSFYTYATQVAEVEVNLEKGEAKVLRVIAAQDVGKAVNPLSVEGQIEGGVLFGLGFALTEDFIPGKTHSFAQYRIPRITDAPQIVPIIVEVAEPTGPFGAKGMGESTSNATAPAIINAIENACGIRIFDLPATPRRIFQALRGIPPNKGDKKLAP